MMILHKKTLWEEEKQQKHKNDELFLREEENRIEQEIQLPKFSCRHSVADI
jgi:hypothetical protein